MYAGVRTSRLGRRRTIDVYRLKPNDVVVGKDVLELVSSAMYVDPMTVYREYIQNAADAIDEARRTGGLSADEPSRVDIEVDLRLAERPYPRQRLGNCVAQFRQTHVGTRRQRQTGY